MAVGSAYLLPPLSSGGASIAGPLLRFHTPLIEPDVQISRIRLSDKTFIGRFEKGFEFLGYHFGPNGLSVATKTIEQFVARATRLYEQEPDKSLRRSMLLISRCGNRRSL